jgi:cytochrome P450
MELVGNVVPITMISRLIGFRGADIDRLLRAAFLSTGMLASTITMARLQELVAAIDDIQTWITSQIEESRSDPGEDILGSVAQGIEADALSVAEGAITLHTLLSAGGESTTSLLGNSVRILAEQPDLQARLRRDLTLVPAFVEEALRLESPFRYLMRSVPHDTTLQGVAIPAGATILLFWGAANRDPHEHERPDEVDLDRRVPRHHVAFGRGIHHCVGAPLARLEAAVVLTTLLEQTSEISLDPQRPPVWLDSLLVRRHEHLPVS